MIRPVASYYAIKQGSGQYHGKLRDIYAPGGFIYRITGAKHAMPFHNHSEAERYRVSKNLDGVVVKLHCFL